MNYKLYTAILSTNFKAKVTEQYSKYQKQTSCSYS